MSGRNDLRAHGHRSRANEEKPLGGVIYPVIFYKLVPQVGFGWATRTLAFIMLGTLCISLAVMKVRVVPKQKRALFQLSAFKELPFTFFSLGLFFGFMGLYIPFFYISGYASADKISSDRMAFYLLVIMNAASIFGRTIPNFIADKTGPLNMLIPCAIVSCILGFCWIGIHNTAGLIVFAALYGFFSGTFVSLPPTTVVTLSPDLSMVGTRMGMSFAFAGLGLLVGNPVAGAILGTGTQFVGVQALCAGTVALSVVFMTLARYYKVGPKLTAKA